MVSGRGGSGVRARRWSRSSPRPPSLPGSGCRPTPARELMADALDLAHRLPRLWARVQALEVKVSYARLVARKTRDLTTEQAGYVDERVVESADGRIPWSRFELLVEADGQGRRPRGGRRRGRRPNGVASSPTPPPPPRTGCAGSTSAARSHHRPARRDGGVLRPRPGPPRRHRQRGRTPGQGGPDPGQPRPRPIAAQAFPLRGLGSRPPAGAPDVSARGGQGRRVARAAELRCVDRRRPPRPSPLSPGRTRPRPRPPVTARGGETLASRALASARLAQPVHPHGPRRGPGGRTGHVPGGSKGLAAAAAGGRVTDADGRAADAPPLSPREIPATARTAQAGDREPQAPRSGTPTTGSRPSPAGQVQQPFPGIYLWRDPFGAHYLVDHTGTRRLGPTGEAA